MDELERKVRGLIDKDEIRDLALRYALYSDQRDLDALALLYSQDTQAGQWGSGRDGVRSMFDDVLRGFTNSIHLVANHTIELSGDTAIGNVYGRVEIEQQGQWLIITVLYRDEYVREDDAWKFRARHPEIWYATDFEQSPVGDKKVRFPNQPPTAANVPAVVWPTWDKFWGHGGSESTVKIRTVKLKAADVELAADIRGNESDPVVLLLHGGGQTRHSWDSTAAVLARHGWCSISVDMRGHGDSDWSPDGNYGFQRFRDDVIAVARQFDRPALVGASLGGASSMLAILEAEDTLARGLVLVDIAHRINTDGRQRIGSFMHSGLEGFSSLDEAADAIAAYNPHRPRPRNLVSLQKNLRQRNDGRWYWHYDPRFITGVGISEEMREYPTELFIEATKKISRLKLPTMLVRGKLSDIVDEEYAEELVQLIPHAQTYDVKGAGHMVAGDNNDLFNEAVVTFLNSQLRNQ